MRADPNGPAGERAGGDGAGSADVEAALGLLPVPAALLDPGGRVVAASRAWETHGHPLAEALEPGAGQPTPGLRALGEALKRLCSGPDGDLEHEVDLAGGGGAGRSFTVRGRRLPRCGLALVVAHSAEPAARLERSARLAALGQLTGAVAHDFNNLLTAVSGYAELLLRDLPLNDLGRGYAERIHDAARRAEGVTRQLLTYARREPQPPRQLDLGATVHEMRPLLEVLGRQLELRVETAPGPLLVEADPGQLEQLVLNLALNARDAMPRGGRLELRAFAVTVLADVPAPAGLLPGPYAVLEVSDTGSGVPPELLPRIFEPFVSSKPAGQGTGLGLSTVAGIARARGGAVDVATSPAGSRFAVYLPLRAVRAASAALPATTEGLRSGRGRVLLVDDEESVRELCAEVLAGAGFEVRACSGAAEALAAWEEDGFDLLLSDMAMPGGTGLDLAAALRARSPRLPVVLMSGYGDPPGSGADELVILPKPFSPRRLVEVVQRELEREREGRPRPQSEKLGPLDQAAGE